MLSIILGQNFLDFLFFIGFPILFVKILSFGIQNFISRPKLDYFFLFLVVSIVEIIISSIWVFKYLKITNILLSLSIIFFIIVLNLINFVKMTGFSSKKYNTWGDFFQISFLGIIFFIILMSFLKFRFF